MGSSADMLAQLPGDSSVPTPDLTGLQVSPDLKEPLNPRTRGPRYDLLQVLEKPSATQTPTAQPPSTPPADPYAGFATRVIGAEGLGQNPNSSAFGYGQFTAQTWLTTVMGEPEVAGKTPAEVLQLRSDQAFATRMVEKLAAKNGPALSAAGLPVNDTTLYLAHFLGSAGAVRVLQLPPDTPLNRVLSADVLKANPQLTSMTTGSLQAYLAQSLEKKGTGGLEPDIEQYRQIQQAALDREGKLLADLTAAVGRAPAGSDEAHRLLQQAIQRSGRLADQFEKLSQKPPQMQSPIEAAGVFAPLLIGLVSMMGRRSARPGLAAINAMSAGLGAMKQGNDEAYKRAYDIWSKQTDLAMQAFKMQNDMIGNIMQDVQLSETQQQQRLMNAFRILGLDKDLTLAKSNLWKDVETLHENRLKLQADLTEKKALADLHQAQAQALTGTAGLKGSAGALYSKGRQLFIAQNGREPTAEEDNVIMQKAVAESRSLGAKPTDKQQAIDDALQAKADELGMTVDKLTPEQRNQVRLDVTEKLAQAAAQGRVTGAPTEAGALRDAIIKRMQADNVRQGKPADLSPEQLEAAAKEALTFHHRAGVSGNEVIRLQQRIDQYGYALNKLNDMFDILNRTGLTAGLGGRVTRPLEAVGNALGLSSDVDRGMFQSDVEYMQAVAARLIEQSDSRGVAGELFGKEQRIQGIVRGLNMGDTTARTVESLTELRQLFTDMRRQTLSMIPHQQYGDWQPLPAQEAPATISPYTPGAGPAAPAAPAVVPPAGTADPFAPFRLQ